MTGSSAITKLQAEKVALNKKLDEANALVAELEATVVLFRSGGAVASPTRRTPHASGVSGAADLLAMDDEGSGRKSTIMTALR